MWNNSIYRISFYPPYTIFLYFLQKNGILYRDNREKRIDDSTLVAVTIMIAESRIEEKELMTRLVMNFLV